MRTLLHSLGNVFLTFLVIILIIYGWVFVEIKFLLKSQPEIFGYAFYIQPDASMSPAIEKNDVVIIKKDSEYKEGDTILYFDGEDSLYKVQAVVNTDANSTTTRCSQCKEDSEPISNDNIVGKATGKVAFMGKIILFFKQKAVLFAIALIGVIFLVISQYMEYKPKKEIIKE